MDCQVLVTPEDSTGITLRWSSDSALGALAELSRFLVELCLGRVKKAGAGDPAPDRIFLTLMRDELLTHRDRAPLGKLTRQLIEHGWGSPVYLVASSSIRAADLRDARASVENWLRAGVQAGLHSLLSVPYDRFGPSPPTEVELEKAVANAQDRSNCLAALGSHGLKWRCFVADDRPLYAQLFSSWARTTASPDQGEHLVVLIDGAQPARQREILAKALRAFPRRHHLVATLRREPTPELSAFCEGEELFGPFRFESELELLFSLLRLSDPRVDETALAAWAAVHLIDHGPALVFGPSSMGQPRLLLTSSFDPIEAHHCRAAAKDVTEVLRELPWGTPFHMEPAITLGRLENLLSNEVRSKFTAWIHMGHGTSDGDLIEADSLNEHTPEEWLACFQGRELSLELAAFLTCNSSKVAKCFARAGAGVAVGYTCPVHTEAARKTAVWIAKQLAVHGFQRHAILRGFDAAAAHLELAGQAGAQPVAYASVRR